MISTEEIERLLPAEVERLVSAGVLVQCDRCYEPAPEGEYRGPCESCGDTLCDDCRDNAPCCATYTRTTE